MTDLIFLIPPTWHGLPARVDGEVRKKARFVDSFHFQIANTGWKPVPQQGFSSKKNVVETSTFDGFADLAILPPAPGALGVVLPFAIRGLT